LPLLGFAVVALAIILVLLGYVVGREHGEQAWRLRALVAEMQLENARAKLKEQAKPESPE